MHLYKLPPFPPIYPPSLLAICNSIACIYIQGGMYIPTAPHINPAGLLDLHIFSWVFPLFHICTILVHVAPLWNHYRQCLVYLYTTIYSVFSRNHLILLCPILVHLWCFTLGGHSQPGYTYIHECIFPSLLTLPNGNISLPLQAHTPFGQWYILLQSSMSRFFTLFITHNHYIQCSILDYPLYLVFSVSIFFTLFPFTIAYSLSILS